MHILIRKLTNHHDISEEEQAAILAALGPPFEVQRGTDIAADGSTPQHTTVILSGTACHYNTMPGGNRHIVAFQYPGEMDLYSYVLKKLDYAIGALTPCTVAQIRHEKIAELCNKYPNLAYAFWRETMVYAAVSHSWALGGGRKSAERVAHMLCEIFVRLEAVGLADLERALPFTVTQKDLADAIGLSLVHTNKTLSVLMKAHLIVRIGSNMRILNWEGLKSVAHFCPEYLHFKRCVDEMSPATGWRLPAHAAQLGHDA